MENLIILFASWFFFWAWIIRPSIPNDASFTELMIEGLFAIMGMVSLITMLVLFWSHALNAVF